MKKVLCVLLALAMVAGVVACAAPAAPAAAPAAEPAAAAPAPAEQPAAPVAQGTEAKELEEGEQIADTITFAYSSGPFTLEPVMVPGDNATLWLTDLLYGTLMRPTPDGTDLYPYLCDSYEISEDGLTYTFKLKQGVKFSDGTDVTVDDWVFSLLRARDTKESNWEVSVENIKDVKAVDASTLEITLNHVSESFLADMSMFNTAVQSKAYIEKIGEEENQIKPMGTGPYMIQEWEIGSHIYLEKNPYFFDADKVKTQYVHFNIVPDTANRILQLKSGEADIIDNIPFNNIAELNNEPGITAMGIGSTETQYLCMNYKHPILKDVRVRHALRYATDCQQIVDLVLAGFGSPATSYISSSGLYYNSAIQPPEYNPEKAKELLAEAGYPNGFDLTIITRPDRQLMEEVATILKDQWAMVGVNLNIQSVEKSSYLDMRNNCNFEISPITWVDDIPHPSQVSEHLFDYSKERGLFCDFQSDEGFEILQKALVELDPEKCAEYYGQLQQIWYDECPAIMVYYANIPVALRDSVRGFVQTSLGRYRLEDCYKVVE